MFSSVFWSCTSRHSAGVRTDWLTRRPASQRCCRNAEIASLLASREALGFEQQQQVDIGVREQLPASVAAHGEQGSDPAGTAGARPPRQVIDSAVRSASAVASSARNCGSAELEG